jgi:hypothetical protein
LSITADDLRARLGLGAVAVVGAGLSLSARYPDTRNLSTLVWDALDSDRPARAALAVTMGSQDQPAKTLVGDDQSALDAAWTAIAGAPIARHRFQRAFVALDGARASRTSVPHEALARLIHEGSVELVISFNWDSALERAYERVYGTSLPKDTLLKPHGDVAHPSDAWVLPHEDGVVTDEIHARVNALVNEHPRILVIVGYSGSDKTVVDQLIAPLDERWRVTRISPSADGPDDVAGTAGDVLAALTQHAVDREAASAWGIVTFGNQRGIEAALAGHRLGPRDVDACPRLPVVSAVRESLLRTHAVVLNGDSGSGKSISAYQVASELAQEGYEILRLRDSHRHAGTATWRQDLYGFPRPKVLFIDDAQDLSADTVRELAETATQDQLVLIAGVDHVAGGVVTHTVAGTAAVGVLERFMLDNRARMLPKVHVLDDRVGESFIDEPFDLRVRLAAKEHNAWLFFYSLTGGWRRTTRVVLEIRDRDRADLLACALAVAQIAGVDSGVTVDDLSPYAAALDRNQDWVKAGLAVLNSNQLAFQQDGVWRCPHLRAAYAILNWMLHPPVWPSPPPKPPVNVGPIASATTATDHGKDPPLPPNAARVAPALPEAVVEEDRKNAISLIEVALIAPATSMRGIAWLLGRNNTWETGWVLKKHGVRTSERDRAFAARAMSTSPGPDVAMAAQLLNELHGPDAPEITATVWEHIETVTEWVRHVTPQNGWAIGNLVNILCNEDRERISAAIATTDPAQLTKLYRDGGWPHIYSIHRAVDRISQGGGIEFLKAVGEAFDEEELSSMLDTAPDLWSANELLSVFPYMNPVMGIRLFDSHAEQFGARFSRDPLNEHSAMFDTFAFLLGYAPGFLRHAKPKPAQRRALVKFLRALDTKKLQHELTRPRSDRQWHNFWDFMSMFHEADPTTCAQVADTLDLDQLEQTLIEQLPEPTGNLILVLGLVGETREEAVLAMFDRHEPEIGAINSYLAYVHPDLVIRLLKRGLPLDLQLEHQYYDHAAPVLALLGAQDADVAAEVAAANASAFAAGLASNHSTPFIDLTMWVAACDRYAPGFIEAVLTDLDAGVVAGWADALRVPKSKRHIAPLVVRAAELGECPAAQEASALLKRFTSLRSRRPAGR